MAVSSDVFIQSNTKYNSVIIVALILSLRLVIGVPDHDRHKRDVVMQTVDAPNVIPENVSSSETLFNLATIFPNRSFVVTNNSAGVAAMFQVTNGRLTLAGNLSAENRKRFDYEMFRTFEVKLNATNQTNSADVIIVTVRMPLSDVNDEAPEMSNKPKPFLATITQNASPGTIFYTMTITDADSNPNLVFGIDQAKDQNQNVLTTRFQYSPVNGGSPQEKKYNIMTVGSGTFQPGAEITITTSAQDLNTVAGPRVTSGNILVLVGQRPPQFFEQTYEGQIYETSSTNSWVLESKSNSKLGIQVLQFQPGNSLTFKLLDPSGTDSQYFDIRPEGSVQRVVNKVAIDYETIKYFSLIIQVVESGTGLSSTAALIAHVKDENDNSPTFMAPLYTASVREDVAVGFLVVSVSATDRDSGLNGEIFFLVLNTTFFDVTTHALNTTYVGAITVKSSLDYDSNPRPIQFNVVARDRGTPALSSSVQVIVAVLNVNDNPPTIVNSTTTYYLNEMASINTVVMLIQASDIDGDGVKFYFEGKRNVSEIFSIRETNGQILLNKEIPKEKDSYTLNVMVVDDDTCCGSIKNGFQTAYQTFTVNIIDINANKPNFVDCLKYDTEASVKELSPYGTFVIQVSAKDDDRGENGVCLYSIETPDPNSANGVFQIDRDTGNITVKGNITNLDRRFIEVTVVARNPPLNPIMEGRCTFRIAIIDVNNHPPTFSKANFEVQVSITTRPPSNIIQMVASDKDVGPNANITYSFDVNDTAVLQTFSIDTLTGMIRLIKQLTSSQLKYVVVVVANDNGIDPGPLNGTTTVTIIVSLDNRTPPEWTSDVSNLTFSVSENAPLDYVITTLGCKSNTQQPAVEFRVYDAGETISTDSMKFKADWNIQDPSRMNLSVRARLDYEVQKNFQLSLVCQTMDALVLRAPLATVNIKVEDENDVFPEFIGLNLNGRYVGAVPENSPAGTSVLQVAANDKDSTPPFNLVTFYLDGPNKEFFMIKPVGNENNRADIVTTDLLKPDRENQSYYSVRVVAVDGNNSTKPRNTAERYCDIFISDVNDNPPVFNLTKHLLSVSENAAVTDIVGVVTATDPDEIDQIGLQYRFISGNINNAFYILPITGEIRVARKLDYENPNEPKVYNLTLMALDQNQVHNATTIVIIVVIDENDNRPVCSQSVYIVRNTVTEEDTSITPNNRFLLVQVTATDADVNRTQTALRYYLSGTSHPGADQLFTVDISGNVFLIGALDRDIPPHFYTVTVEVKDELEDPLSSFCDVQVFPMDINDNSPEFNTQYLQGSVEENQANAYVMTMNAYDKDAGENGTVKFRLAAEQPNAQLAAMFEVRDNSIYTTNNVTLLDRETIERVLLNVEAYDMGIPSRSSIATATITVTDANDNMPFFDQQLYSATVSEHQTSGVIMRVPAIDLDIDPRNKDLYFKITGPEEFIQFFEVRTSGSQAEISIKKPIDYESDPRVLTFYLNVTDRFPVFVNFTTIKIIVTDYNDNAPEFKQKFINITLVEEEPYGKIIANFTATDRDEGINAEIKYLIPRSSDPRYELYIDPNSGQIMTRKKLDREKQERMIVIILAVDKGEIPLTGTGTLSITLTDINDNGPRFREDYRPVVPENKDNSNTLVQEIFAIDPDTPENGPPFTFSLPPTCDVPACIYFSLTYNAAADDGKGTATIRTSTRFDREQTKFYYLPIVMSDRNGGDGSQTVTNTLTITIGDENDNNLEPGNQDIFVFNYEGQFVDIEIGRVYANDPDDWDLPDKTFTYLSPDSLKAYFGLDSQTGMITLKPNVPPNNGQAPYQFKVNVYDKKFDKAVTCTVSVVVQLITDEAVRKSGGVRLAGITAEEFVKPISTGPQTYTSKYKQFKETVAALLDYPSMDNIEIVSLTEVTDDDGNNYLDVRFSTHGSPYLNPTQGESAIMLDLDKFQKTVGLTVVQVPINLCMDEIYDTGCYNYLNVTGKPQLVNSNGTSYVIMKTTLSPEEGCVDSMFPDPIECRGDYCFNGGTCIQDDWGKLSCACLPGFDGPRCQQRRHNFDGTSAAFYQGLSTCSSGRTSIEFSTLDEDGLIMYSGPIVEIDQTEDARDYLILEMKQGYPSLRLNLGGKEELSLQITGKDTSGAVKVNKLNDGQWHELTIDRDNQEVTLTVDHCKYAETTNGTVFDWSPCRLSGIVKGPGDVLLNVHSFLQLGGRYPTNSFPTYPANVPSKGFIGCVRNLVHNSKLYDLYYRDLPSWNSGKNGCPREEAICGQATTSPVCGQNATCEANLQTGQVSLCRCNPGWYGDKCSKVAPTKDLQTNSYFAWDLRQTLVDDAKRSGSFQMMFRTRRQTGTLFVLTNVEMKTIILKLVNGQLALNYDLGQGLTTLELPNAIANSGQWTVVRMERYGNEILLFMDGGEGRNFNYKATDTELGVFFEMLRRVTVGAAVTGLDQVSDDLVSTCIRDVRFNDIWLPLTTDQNNNDASLVRSQGVKDGCTREDCASVTCDSSAFCYPLWETHECRCPVGGILVGSACVATCNPNPCLNSGVCNIVSGKVACTCAAGWSGTFCDAQEQVNPDDAGLGAGAIAGIVIAILVLLILLILLLIFLLTRKRSEKEKILVVDPDDDFIRENVVFYDEEGAGEEDHAAYDISLLQKPLRETNAKPVFSPVTESEMRRQNAPWVDRPNPAPRMDRPDVGSFIKDRINDAENNDPSTDSTREFNFEGGNSDAGSLSSLNTSSSGGSQDYDYLSDWGPKFAKLADMYGAGQNLEEA